MNGKFLALLACAALSILACEGPRGAAGTDGAEGGIGPTGQTGPAGTFAGAFVGDATIQGSLTVTNATIVNGVLVTTSSASVAKDLTVTGTIHAMSAPGLVPPGTIVAYAGATAPAGWLSCNGASVLRADYPALFAAIGTGFGSGSATTFNVPDLRGRFLRGVDHDVGLDPNRAARTAMNAGGNTGDAVGSVQSGATAFPATAFTTGAAGNHAHDFTDNYFAENAGMNLGIFGSAGGLDGDNQFFSVANTTLTAGSHTHGISGGDAETRPTNAGVEFIVKY